MVRGWEFRWQTYHYYVGAPDPATAREYLRKRHPVFAENAPAPKKMPQKHVQSLKLMDGSVRCAVGKGSFDA